jgi:putative copper export protein
MSLDQHLLGFTIRWIHVCSMAFLLGGTILLFWLSLGSNGLERVEHNRMLLFAAEKYELVFWFAVGIQVVTGVGNLGELGLGLPDPNTAWGLKLLVKLSLFLILLVLSLIRTLLITRLTTIGTNPSPASLSRVFSRLYAGTGIMLAVIVLLAVSLAHG